MAKIEKTEQRMRQAALKRKLEELAGSSRQREELKIETVADTLDQVMSNTDRELAITRLEGHARLLRDVRIALARIEDGTYGLCEECEEPIPAKRLDAVPWARLCVRCQEQAEARTSEKEMNIGEAA